MCSVCAISGPTFLCVHNCISLIWGVLVFVCALRVPFERLFHVSSCRKVVARAADQSQK